MKRALIVRNGTSGRFTPIAETLQQAGWTGAVINGAHGSDVPGWIDVRWGLKPPPEANLQRSARRFRDALLCAQAAATAAQKLQSEGFVPDVIVGHPGWGEMMLLSEVFPGVPQIHLGEFYYHVHGADTNFDPEFPSHSFDSYSVIKTQNAILSVSYAEATAIVAPTPFQASVIPADFHPKIEVIHEGVDLAQVHRRPPTRLALPDGFVIDGSVPVISFVNRRFEPMRGFHVFMRMLPRLLALVPDLHVVLVGADEPALTYGARPDPSRCWREVLLGELVGKLDEARIHFVPPVRHEALQALFSMVTAHVYLTYPFVLSWSLLDAMACEALVVASNTPPVRDVIEHGRNGLLVDFFDGDAMANTLAAACRSPASYHALRRAAHETVVTQYDRKAVCMPAWRALIERIVD